MVKFCNFILCKVIHTWLGLLIYFLTYMKLLVLLLWVFIVLFILLKTSHYYCGHKSISHWFIYISIVSSYFHTITLKEFANCLPCYLFFYATHNGPEAVMILSPDFSGRSFMPALPLSRLVKIFHNYNK